MREISGKRSAGVSGPYANMGEKHLHRVVKEYVEYYNSARPHQGLRQAIPDRAGSSMQSMQQGPPSNPEVGGKVISLPVLGGLYHDYRWAV